MQDKIFCMKVSESFRKGLRVVAKKANEPSVAEFIKRTIIKEAKKYGVKIER